jgi:hypothetical protein
MELFKREDNVKMAENVVSVSPSEEGRKIIKLDQKAQLFINDEKKEDVDLVSVEIGAGKTYRCYEYILNPKLCDIKGDIITFRYNGELQTSKINSDVILKFVDGKLRVSMVFDSENNNWLDLYPGDDDGITIFQDIGYYEDQFYAVSSD